MRRREWLFVYTDMDTTGRRFEWDEAKCRSDLIKHQLDLRRGINLLQDGPTVTVASRRGDEERFVSIGLLGDVYVALVWTERNGAIRLISLRSARDAEKRLHRQRHG
jgi:uncharacterized DUF497 family protein